MNYTILLIVVVMGLKAFIFRKRTRSENHEVNENNSEVLKTEQLSRMNQTLSELYHQLTTEQDNFEIKRNEYNKTHEELKSKKNEVNNRLEYLEGVRNSMGDKFRVQTPSLQEFKEMCKSFVSTHEDLEKAQIELHYNEIELDKYTKTWDADLTAHNQKVFEMRKNIENILKDIENINNVDLACKN